MEFTVSGVLGLELDTSHGFAPYCILGLYNTVLCLRKKGKKTLVGEPVSEINP